MQSGYLPASNIHARSPQRLDPPPPSNRRASLEEVDAEEVEVENYFSDASGYHIDVGRYRGLK